LIFGWIDRDTHTATAVDKKEITKRKKLNKQKIKTEREIIVKFTLVVEAKDQKFACPNHEGVLAVEAESHHGAGRATTGPLHRSQ
jgi:hypothetical protein